MARKGRGGHATLHSGKSNITHPGNRGGKRKGRRK